MDTFAATWHSMVPLAAQLAEDFRDLDMQHQVVALHVKGKRVLGYGVNQKRYANLFSYFYDSLHAEADLIRRYGDKIRGAKVFLYRFNNAPTSPFGNKPLCGKPCPLCSHVLRMAGINRVVWIDDAGEVQSMRGHEMPLLTEHPSVLTQLFLDRSGNEHHGKFFAESHLAH